MSLQYWNTITIITLILDFHFTPLIMREKFIVQRSQKKKPSAFTHFLFIINFCHLLERFSSDPSASQQQLLYKRFGMEQSGPINSTNISEQYYLHA